MTAPYGNLFYPYFRMADTYREGLRTMRARVIL